MMTPAKLLAALLEVADGWFPEMDTRIDPDSHHHLLYLADNSEIDLDQLAEELAQALNVRAD